MKDTRFSLGYFYFFVFYLKLHPFTDAIYGASEHLGNVPSCVSGYMIFRKSQLCFLPQIELKTS